jgi:hypothetical protein
MKLPRIEQYQEGADWRAGGEVESHPDHAFAEIADAKELREWNRPAQGRRRPARARGLLIASGPGEVATTSARLDPPGPVEREEVGEVERLRAELKRITAQRDALADALGVRLL